VASRALKSAHVSGLQCGADWRLFLEERLDCRVEIAFGRSRTKPLQVGRSSRRELRVRMHAMFAAAPEDVRESVARWIRSGRRARNACARLDRWIAERLSELPAPVARRQAVRTRGRHYDLQSLADPLWEAYFAEDFHAARGKPELCWSKSARSRSRHSLRLGSYVLDAHRVRMHPVLDQPAVPEWFVRFVLFHEILHAALPPMRSADERWIHHGPRFRARERAHPDFARARAWEDEHLAALIRSARSGKPPRGMSTDLTPRYCGS
jgi:hypothetical protein